MKKNGALMTELEAERKFRVNPQLLPPLDGGRAIVQGYWPGVTTDTSVRVIPSKQRAFLREKSTAIGPNGEREKSYQEIPYEQGRQLVTTAPRVAFKDRYPVEVGGRLWKIEHFPESGHWQAETEHTDTNPVIDMPPWAMYELTGHPSGYTVTYAHPMRPEDVDGMVRQLEPKEAVPA